MKLNSILCPIDFAESNRSAIEYASVLAKSTGAKIVFFHVIESPVMHGRYGYISEPVSEAGELKRLKEYQPSITGIASEHVVDSGNPADCITEFARQNQVDLVVMGTHGRTGLGRLVMGSVAEAVVRHADCPVLAIKNKNQVTEDTPPKLAK